MIMNKKGAMEMSINLIIIIIVALTVLGLVLGFVVSKFNEADTQFNIEETLKEADYATPITFSGGNTLTLKPNKPTAKRVSIYNNGEEKINLGGKSDGSGEESDAVSKVDFRCTGSVDVSVSENLNYPIMIGETETSQLTLTASGKTGDYFCKVVIINATDDSIVIDSDIKLKIN